MLLVVEPEEAGGAEEEAMAVAKREGSSNISDIRSTFRDTSIALFRLSRTAFSVFDLLYFCEKATAFSSRSGTPFRRLDAEDVRAGRHSPSVDNALDVAMTDRCDLEDKACKDSRLLFKA